MNLLEKMRRRKRAVGRIVLPLLFTAWVSASASPCVGMTASTTRDVRADVAAAVHEHHHGVIHEHDSHGHHKAPQVPVEHGAPEHDHGRCPHCPPGPGETLGLGLGQNPSHVPCVALDDVSTGSVQAKAWKGEPAHLGPVPDSVATAATCPHAPRPNAVRVQFYRYPPVALNLRHCVFLI